MVFCNGRAHYSYNDRIYQSTNNCCVDTGEGGLEVRGDGPGPAVSMDLHVGSAGGHRRHHPPGTHPLRRPDTHRRQALRDRFHYC